MALPWLESIRVLGAPAPFPKRFGVMFMGCGINEDYWSATGDGAAMTLSKTLSPLALLPSQRALQSVVRSAKEELLDELPTLQRLLAPIPPLPS